MLPCRPLRIVIGFEVGDLFMLIITQMVKIPGLTIKTAPDVRYLLGIFGTGRGLSGF